MEHKTAWMDVVTVIHDPRSGQLIERDGHPPVHRPLDRAAMSLRSHP